MGEQAAAVQLITSEFLVPSSSHSPKGLSNGTVSPNSRAIHLVLLNWTLPDCLVRLWEQAVVRVCADGGANKLYDELPAMLPHEPAETIRKRYLPDVILGDLDSLRPDVQQYYVSQGVEVLHSSDQDSTDLMKAVNLLVQRHGDQLQAPLHLQDQAQLPDQATQQGTILALGALGGRLDHTLSNLNALHMYRQLDIGLIGDGNLVRLVRAGRACIRPARQHEGPLCGLVPLSGPATVTMTGFRWNLEAGLMQVGGLVSTSNIIDDDEITVETDRDLVWTTQLPHPTTSA